MAERPILARHTKHKSPHPLLQILSGFFVVVAVLLTSAAGVGAFLLWDSYQRFSDNSVELPSDAIAQKPPEFSFDPYPGEVNFLLAGTDECEPEFSYLFGDRCDGSETGARNDVTLLVHVPEDHSSATVVSFPRDLMTSFPECTNSEGRTISASSSRQLNSAYDSGGLGCVAAVVENLSGLKIPFAAKISWGGVITITDQLGGVDVCVANGIYDRYTGLELAPGTHTLQGTQALQFLRTRHGLSDGSDLARISNQQLYMAALLKKLTNERIFDNPLGMLRISETIVNNVEHSTSLNDASTLTSLALLLKELPLDKITFLQLPTVADPSNPNRVIISENANESFWNAIKEQQAIQVETKGSGAIISPSETPVDPNAPSETPPQMEPNTSAPGMNAAANACANGAG